MLMEQRFVRILYEDEQRCARMFVLAIEQQGVAQQHVFWRNKGACGTADGRKMCFSQNRILFSKGIFLEHFNYKKAPSIGAFFFKLRVKF